jgi:hypothetical protein
MSLTRTSLMLAALLSAAACGSPYAPTANGSPTTFLAVGQAVDLGENIMYSVTSVQAPWSSGNNSEVAKHGQYLAVAVLFQNNSSRDFHISSLISFRMRDGNGQTYGEELVSTAPNTPDALVPAGSKLTGTLIYDVPKGQRFKLYFTNDIFQPQGSFERGPVIAVDLGTH